MRNQRRIRRAVLWVMAVMLTLSGGIFVYADEYHNARDGEISLYLPDDWTVSEIIGEEISEDQPYEQILEAVDGSGKTSLTMELYYMSDEITDTEYFYIDDAEEDAMRYFESYGKAALETLYGNLEGISDTVVGTPVFFEGEWNGFLVAPVTGTVTADDSAFADTVYLTCDMTNAENILVHNILMFYNEDNSAITGDTAEVAEAVADEFYDYGYANIMVGADDGSSELWTDDGGDGFDSDLLVGLIAMVGTLASVFAVGIVIARKMKKRIQSTGGGVVGSLVRQGRALQNELSESLDGGKKKWRKPRKKEERQTHDHIQQTIRSNEINRRDGKRTSDAEERYFRSLETLRKSGLLTREEMRDMLERHERSNRWNRRR